MSRKFNDVRSIKKTLLYGSANGLGPFPAKAEKEKVRCQRKVKKKTAHGATNTMDGKEAQHDT